MEMDVLMYKKWVPIPEVSSITCVPKADLNYMIVINIS